MLKILKSKQGEGYIDVAILVLCAMLVIALAVRVFPAYIIKQQVHLCFLSLCFWYLMD